MDFRKRGAQKRNQPIAPRRMDCTESEFDDFVKSYPRKLEVSTHAMYDPPLVCFNDFTLGKHWPASVVATYMCGYYPSDPKRNNFQILHPKARING